MKTIEPDNKSEYNKALQFLKDKHNGEIPYKFGRNEMARWMTKYASTKAEEEAKAFAIFVMQPYTTDPLKPEDFEDRYNQFKKDK